MKNTDYIGIDYGMGIANVDKETGIRYGVISQHSIMPECLDDVYTHGKDVGYDEAVADLQERYKGNPEELERELEDLNLNWELQLGNLEFEQDGYRITGCLDYDLFILKSPYYTHCQYCSPCVPGAGNLDTHCATGPKTYCLGHDWFENEKAPYPVYSVETGELVEPAEIMMR